MIYKRKRKDGTKSGLWSYDFVHRGRRHKGPTGIRDKKLAQDFEDQLKAEARLGRPLSRSGEHAGTDGRNRSSRGGWRCRLG